VIVVTGEDKSIRVFEHDGRGHLRYISQRYVAAFYLEDRKLTGIVSCPNGHVPLP
jgi:hypothetical protein